MELGDDGGDGLVDAALEGDRVGPGGHIAQPLTDERLSEDGGGGGAIACDVVGLLRNFLDEFGADALEGIFEFDLLGDGDAVLRDRRSAPLLVEDDIAALGAEGDLDGVGEEVEAALHAAACFLVEVDDLGHSVWFLPRCGSGAVPATDEEPVFDPVSSTNASHRPDGFVTLPWRVPTPSLALDPCECKTSEGFSPRLRAKLARLGLLRQARSSEVQCYASHSCRACVR